MLPVLLLALAAAPQGEGFTIADLLSLPFSTGLQAAPAGSRAAWIVKDRGVRNVWATDPEHGPAAVTAFGADDGQEISELALSPDGSAIAFVRGGGPNGRGEAPNPTSASAAPEQAVWLVAPGKDPRRIGPGHSPRLSSLGVLAYVHKRDVYSVPVAGGDPAVLFHTGGQAESLRFSPDGSHIAFVSSRDDHSFVGVFDMASQTVTYLDPSVDRDLDPCFSPDGARVAFLRVAAADLRYTFGPTRTAEPWSIRVVEVSTGKGREVFRATPGVGSFFHGLPIDNQILWGAGDRLVFPWEKTGYKNLYTVPASGGEASPLVGGSFEVEDVALSPDRKTVVLNSNQGDTDRRHLFSVGVSGGKVQALTEGTGIEWAPVLLADGTLAYLASDARTPAHPMARKGAAVRELMPRVAPGWTASLVVPEAVLFPAADGLVIHGQLFRPRVVGPGSRLPAVIFFHGGSRRQMLLGFHYLDYYSNAYALNQYLASLGFVVLSVNYRSGIGYGLDFREALNYGAHGASEFQDVVGAGLYLRTRQDVDPSRIGLWGGSYGGYLTALGLARASDLFAAGVDFHGVHDWNLELPVFAPGYNPEKERDLARLAYESSPMASVSTWRSPVLLIHGDDDRNVPFAETVTLVEALRKQGVPFEELVFPDEIHDFLLHSTWVKAYGATADFLVRRLKEPRP
jgi:dipeptidyl aminopeptidase/acylaminoacyl peptidase